MESICNAPGTIKGIEVLFFEEAEVTKMKSGQPSFATFGPMSVLYFPQYNRFVLQINDWRYPLLRRLSINSSGSGNYNLPGPNGSTFSLKINKPGQALGNLDALLEGTRKLEASPEDKLVRMKKQADTGPKEVIGETLKQVVHKVQNKVQTLKTGTKNLTSTKKRVNLKDIKNKNFKKEAHSKIKKDFFQTSEKLANEFSQRRKENVNLTQSKQLDELKKTSASHAAVYYVPQVEIEEAILNLKEIDSAPKTENKGVVGRERIPEVQQGNAGKTLVSEGMTHYQG